MADLISRADAVAIINRIAIRHGIVGLPVCMVQASDAINAMPAADLSSHLGAVAMRDAAAQSAVDNQDCSPWEISEAIRAIPLPTHAAQLAAALKLPEVAAMVQAVTREIEARNLFLATAPDRGGLTGPKAGRKAALDAAQIATVKALSALEASHE